jgi:hypothetical protein
MAANITSRERRAALRAGMPNKGELRDLVVAAAGPFNADDVLAVLNKHSGLRASIVQRLRETESPAPWVNHDRLPQHFGYADHDFDGWSSAGVKVANFRNWAKDQLARTTALVHLLHEAYVDLQPELSELLYVTLCGKYHELELEINGKLKMIDAYIGHAKQIRTDRVVKAQKETLMQAAKACALQYVPPDSDDAVLTTCVAAELERLGNYMSQPQERDNLVARINAAHPHPAWFCKAQSADDAMLLLRRAFCKSMSDKRPADNKASFRTECDFASVQSRLLAWWENGTSSDELADVRIDQRLYRAFVAVLGPDAYRYVAPLQLNRLEPLCRTRVQVELLVAALPEECLFCNGDPAQNQVWTRPELVDHIWFHVNESVGGNCGLDMPWRPYVTVLVKRALNDALAELEQAKPKAKPQQQAKKKEGKKGKK